MSHELIDVYAVDGQHFMDLASEDGYSSHPVSSEAAQQLLDSLSRGAVFCDPVAQWG